MKLLLPVITCLAFLFLFSFNALAQGVTIAPPFQEVGFDKTTQQVQFSVDITNNTNATLDFALSTQDFGTLNETGGIAFLGASASDFEKKYGLSSYLTLEKDFIEVPKGKTEKVIVYVTNTVSLSPGGHYAAVLAKIIPQKQAADFTDNVALQQTISSLILVKKTGGEIYKLSLAGIGSLTSFFGFADIIDLRFQNSGNVHIIPRGIVTISDPLGRVVQKGIINENSAFILPETFRLIPATMESKMSALIPGIYHVQVQYRYDGKLSFETQDESLFFIPPLWYLILIVILFAVFGYKKYVEHNK